VRNQIQRLSRLLLAILFTSLLAACGDSPTNTPAATSATTATTVATSATSAITAATTNHQTQGELRIGTGINVPTGLDVTKGSNGYNMVTYGAGETLMRFNREQKLESWLAESITSQDATTWQVKLRKGVKFHDGSPVNAQAVADSFKSSWTNLAGATNFISKETQVTVVDDYTLNFKTPTPAGDFPYNAASWNFVIHKPTTPISTLTGMYKPVKLEKDVEFALEAFDDHWSGSPPFKKLSVKVVVDINARVLALQSGDLDMLTNVPAEVAKGLPAEIETTNVGGTRMHYVILNNARAPFNDKSVREATALAVDRDALSRATLDGKAIPATNAIPSLPGLEVVPAQRTDVNRAKQLLDEAGWKLRAGGDGVREKDGKKLAFTLYSYPGRAELTQMAVVMQSQLKAVGYNIKVEEVRDITAQIKEGNFDAAFYSVGLAGDPQYMYGVTLIKGALYNFGGYLNGQLDALYERLRAEPDVAKRQQLSRQIQEISKADTPNVYLVAPPLITAFKKGAIKGYTPHPNDLYLIDRNISK
jgi:peptide/nickel transport system substrate-binding protein